MSFEPTILLVKSDLVKHTNSLETEAAGKPGMKADVAKYLLKAIAENEQPMWFGNFDLILIKPELTYFNDKVRTKLLELDVKYEITI